VLVNYSSVFAQNCNLLYFCEKYENGEVNCSDRFTAGKITIMVKLKDGFDSTSVTLQITKYSPAEDKFDYYKEIIYDVEKGTKFIFFPNIEINDKGIYRVFLLDTKKNRLASSLVEII
jgi:hypothetical protein